MKYRDLIECLACGGKNLTHVLDLGWQPLANTYPKVANTKLERYPLETNFCKDCSHVQLSIAVDPDEMFRDYLYVSGTSQTLREHHEQLAKQVIKPYGPLTLRSLDIGCNDGTLMRGFIKAGLKPVNVWGVDPATSLSQAQEGMNIVNSYWNIKTAWMFDEFNVVTALNVFPHNADPLGFLKAVRRVLTYAGKLVVEMPYAPNNFLEGQFEQIYHEHVSYFSAQSMVHLADRAGFNVVSAEYTHVFGGSVRYTLTVGGGHDDGTVRALIQYELAQAYDTEAFHNTFSDKARRSVDEIETHLDTAEGEGYTCVAYGASAKLSVITNAFRNKKDCPLSLVVDDNPMKQGRFTPGLDIPIAPPEHLSKIESGLLILCGAQNYLPEIKRKLKALRPGAKDLILTTWDGAKIDEA